MMNRSRSPRETLAASVILLSVAAASAAGCALFTPANLPTTELVAKDIVCIAENAFLDDPTLNAVCKLLTPGQRAEGATQAAIHRAAIGSKMAAMRAVACSDGGTK